MFKRVKEFFQGETSLAVDSSGTASDQDVRIATGVLLLEISGSDQDYAPEEVQAIFRTMKTQFKMEEDEVMDLLEIADAAREEKGKIDEFVKSINDNFTSEQKQLVLAMVWKVVIADGQVDKFEKRFAAQLRARLQLTDEQAELAHAMAERGKI